MKRREFLSKIAVGAAGIAASGMSSKVIFGAPHVKRNDMVHKVMILGIDGMDPLLLSNFVKKGKMPAFKKFIDSNHFGHLFTTMPPQSPVAWSSFISGMNPGGHGIFDFIHRDPETLVPYLSTSFTEGPSKKIGIGKWNIPLNSGKIDLLRKGPAFWTLLEDIGIPATLFKLPANFPPLECHSQTISGLGTPDVLGTYGTFSYYTDVEIEGADDFTGGKVYPVNVVDHVVAATLIGPENTFRKDGKNAEIEFKVFRDPVKNLAKIVVQGKEILIKQGEISEWIPLKFELMPYLASMSAMAQFYMQEVHPNFRLYVSPINIDPMDPALPICTPDNYSREVAEAVGRFCTKGFPEDTKALSHGVFSNQDYLVQANSVLDERLRLYDYELNRFDEGLFFFYFSSIDQNTHMMWRTMDEKHHLYDPDESSEVKHHVQYCYEVMDKVLAQALSKVDSKTTLMIVSDHGFSPFTREFHLSSWLVENGYVTLKDPNLRGEDEFFENVDWSKTKAYALGLNGLYINVRGRDRYGTVRPSKAKEISKEIAAKLAEYKDPLTGQKVITKGFRPSEIYSGDYTKTAPDLILGYNRGYRISDEAVLGTFPEEIIGDREDKWSADHCMDSRVVPGVLLTNRRVTAELPGLQDMAPTILGEFGIEAPGEMNGKRVFEKRKA